MILLLGGVWSHEFPKERFFVKYNILEVVGAFIWGVREMGKEGEEGEV
jgi:hypothetical protein